MRRFNDISEALSYVLDQSTFNDIPEDEDYDHADEAYDARYARDEEETEEESDSNE